MMYERIPDELKKLPNWVCWQGIPGENGKIRKLPINPRTGGRAMSNNPTTWTDFETAVRASERYHGIGFMFQPPYFGVDLDDIDAELEEYRSGRRDNIVYEFIHSLCSYAEYSQSGKGIHIICKGTLPAGGRRKKNVEMYQDCRYFIMTGNPVSEYTDIRDCTQEILPLHEKYIGGNTVKTIPRPPHASAERMEDSELLKRAFRSKQGQMLSDLYHGRWQSHYSSQSEADLAFCSSLAFWCACDRAQMERIFRSSGLMREKWDRHRGGDTYGNLTLEKSIQNCTRTYEQPVEYSVSFVGKPKPPKLYTLDDMGNAERLTDAYSDRIRYSYVNKSWYVYDGKKWNVDQSGKVEQFADIVIDKMQNSLSDYRKYSDEDEIEKKFRKHMSYSRFNKAKNCMLAEAKHRVAIIPNEMDQYPFLLNTEDGVLNCKDGILQPHNAELFLTKMTSCHYKREACCPRWIQFLNEIFGGDRELIDYIQKAVGYSMTGSTREQCAFFCYGNGRNGKSTFLDIISTMMGDYAANIQPDTVMLQRGAGSSASSDIARLKGARFVTSVEPAEGMKLNEGLIKQLTGGDKVTARFLYGNEFEFVPEFKLWMGTNHKPVIRGTDTGIWRRVHLIPFTVTIPEEKVDKQLMQELRKELSGILRWAVEGCLRWQKEGLTIPKAVSDATKEYRSEMDVISAFLEECCFVGAGREKAADLFKAYSLWAEDNNDFKMSSRKFGMELGKRFEKLRDNQFRYYHGLKLREEFRPYHIGVTQVTH